MRKRFFTRLAAGLLCGALFLTDAASLDVWAASNDLDAGRIASLTEPGNGSDTSVIIKEGEEKKEAEDSPGKESEDKTEPSAPEGTDEEEAENPSQETDEKESEEETTEPSAPEETDGEEAENPDQEADETEEDEVPAEEDDEELALPIEEEQASVSANTVGGGRRQSSDGDLCG
ncbi:MAG: hypothetical protein NC318_00010 [Blautia sp.]|nr:hypothetical protein [Lachnoclostridium sp.]MCM1209971.1 hypothetical protein [Blautia sp.]